MWLSLRAHSGQAHPERSTFPAAGGPVSINVYSAGIIIYIQCKHLLGIRRIVDLNAYILRIYAIERVILLYSLRI